MHKAARDQAITRLSAAEHDQFRRLLQDIHSRAKAVSDHGVAARQVLVSHRLSPPAYVPLLRRSWRLLP